MYCTTCGYELSGSEKFCPECGKTTAKNSARPTFQNASGKRLVRAMRDKSIAGVCAGFAQYLDVDVTLMRIIWLCAAIFTGIGFIAYLVCWIVMPPDWGPAGAPASAARAQAEPSPESGSSVA